MVPKRRTTYEEIELVALHDGVPELGVEAGKTGTIVTVYEGGRMLLVDLEVGEDGSLGLISYTPFGSR